MLIFVVFGQGFDEGVRINLPRGWGEARGKLGIEENAIFSQPFGVGGASLRWLGAIYGDF